MLTLELNTELESELQCLADVQGRPVSQLLKELVLQYLEDAHDAALGDAVMDKLKNGQTSTVSFEEVKRLHKQPCFVHVTFDNGIWTAECDVLGLVTEADTYEALIERVWLIAPELAELNNVEFHVDNMCFHFYHEEIANRFSMS